jgi:hypothetical protein
MRGAGQVAGPSAQPAPRPRCQTFILAAMLPAALPAAQAQTISDDPAQAAADTAHRRLLAQEQSLVPTRHDVRRPPTEGQVEEYWRNRPVTSQEPSGHVAGPLSPVKPGGQPSWVTPALGALAAVLALVAGVAVLVVRRASRGQRAGQTA